MTRHLTTIALTAAALSLVACTSDNASTNTADANATNALEAEPEATPASASVLDHSADTITGETIDLSTYRGNVVLIVNTASRCGLTPQYEGLQALFEQKQPEGFVVLGFPANNFMNQEPGTNAEILEFCTTNYNVSFPMFAKVSVTGDDKHPLFAELAEQSEEPSWNFTKYLVDREGNLVQRFGPRTSPTDKELTAAIDRLLAAG